MKFRNFQVQAAESLRNGESLLIHAPTGLGKTWATAKGFVDALGTESILGTRLFHVLPVRALARSVQDDLIELQQNLGKKLYKPAIHHGQQQESEIFAERMNVTTIDQYLAGFSGAPLSFASNSGHAVAGAIIGSYSVFDEVHLLGPQKGLPLLYAVLKQRKRWGLLSAVMTATLPKSVLHYLTELPVEEGGLGLTLIKPSDEDIEQRDGWRHVQLSYNSSPLSTKEVTEQLLTYQQKESRVIAFVNTVDAAIDLYQSVKNKVADGISVFIAHSNFAPSHRKEREKSLIEAFGRESHESAILITTQVAEAGLNISAPVVFSELAPVDSLIQRAGRCARFKSQPIGQFIVYTPATHEGRKTAHAPYQEDLVARTGIVFEQRSNLFRLDWKMEQDLVNEALDSYYSRYIRSEGMSRKEAEIKKPKKGEVAELPKPPPPRTKALLPGEALGIFEQTFRMRDPRMLETTLRDITNVQIVVIESEFDFQNYLDRQNILPLWKRDTLESVPVSFGRFRNKVGEDELSVWELLASYEEARGKQQWQFPKYGLTKVHDPRFIKPNKTYVLTTFEAGYLGDIGLSFAEGIEEAAETPIQYHLESDRLDRDKRPFQTWLEHSSGVYKSAERLVNLYRPFIQAWAKRTPSENPSEMAEIIVSLIKVSALFHDIGKLNLKWQDEIGWHEGEQFIGRSKEKDNAPKPKLPPHAFFAFPALRYIFKRAGVINEAGEVDRLAEFIALASARHHSLGTDVFGWDEFKKHPNTLTTIHALLKECQADELIPFVDEGLLEHLTAAAYRSEAGSRTTFAYELDTPSPSDDFYPIYVLANRIVKVADWEDAGRRAHPEGIELCR